MAYKTDNIVILGGGSAGWMAASTLIKAYPNKKVTVVESDKIPTVGVGESTVSDINHWLKFLDIKWKDFMVESDATLKTAIAFRNFLTEDSGTFYNPFGEPDLDGSIYGMNDWFFKKALYPETSTNSFYEYFYPHAHFLEGNKVCPTPNPEFSNYRVDRDIAHQIDATKFGLWLAEKFAIPRGVKRVIGTVAEVKGNEDGSVNSLILENGTAITGDFFIDCSGFRSLLLGKFLKEPFISTKEMLPNNKAWASRYNYTDKEKELVTYTNCTALKNGWVWDTPLYSRVGTGYVYSDMFTTDEEALEEFKAYLDSDAMIVYDPERSSKMEFRQVQIVNGYYERFCVKNVCAFGLSAGFLEPLESTGLYFVHQFLLYFVNALGRGTITEWDATAFNIACRERTEELSRFVSLHYLLSQRDDSPYWKHLTSQPVPEHHRLLALEKYKVREFRQGTYYNCILSGMNVNPISDQVIKEVNYGFNVRRDEEIALAVALRNQKIDRWKLATKSLPNHYHFLRDNFYEI
jgi:tryptophan halogenase